MKALYNLITLLIVSSIVFFACNSKTSENDSTKKELKSGNIITLENISANEVETIISEEKILVFRNASWYIAATKIESFNALNKCLLKGVILNYINKNHTDTAVVKNNRLDSVFIDMEKSVFTFYRKIPGKYSAYEIEYDKQNRIYALMMSNEAYTTEEIKKLEKENQAAIKKINPELKKVKAFDIYLLKGNFEILKVKIDARIFSEYGEDGPSDMSPFSDNVKIDLCEAFNEIGRIYKFSESDLQIVNNQSLKYLRNQFFARRGYIFKTEAMKNYFSKKESYTPKYEDVGNLLTAAEKYNTEFIKQLEHE